MRRTTRAGSWGMILALASPAGAPAAGDDGPPPLTLPGDVTPPIAAPVPTPTPAPAARPRLRPSTNLLRPRAPVLEPGRAAGPAATSPATAASGPHPSAANGSFEPPSFSDGPPPLDGLPDAGGPPALDGPPPLDSLPLPDGPAEVRSTPARPSTNRNLSTRRLSQSELRPIDRAADAPPSLTLEAAPGEDLAPLPDGPQDDPDRIEPRPKDDEPGSPSPSPSRRGLGGLFAPPALRARPQPRGGSSIRVEPRSDPAADAALKRRLEAKVKEAVGAHARDIEVRVVDRNVVIRARADRFWNRRGVRRTIETLPALAGYKASVQVD